MCIEEYWEVKGLKLNKLSPEEKSVALEQLIQEAQYLYPPSEDLISSLRLFEETGIRRSRGRIEHSTLEDSAKFPVLLPPKAEITKLIISDLLWQALHANMSVVLSKLRQHYWIPQGRRTIK
jgi:hypothetical protein